MRVCVCIHAITIININISITINKQINKCKYNRGEKAKCIYECYKHTIAHPINYIEYAFIGSTFNRLPLPRLPKQQRLQYLQLDDRPLGTICDLLKQ